MFVPPPSDRSHASPEPQPCPQPSQDFRKKCLRSSAGLRKGEKLKRPPKGFESAPPDIVEYLKFKQMYFYITLDPKLALTPKIRREVTTRFEQMADFLEWMNEAILEARAKANPEEARIRRPEPMW